MSFGKYLLNQFRMFFGFFPKDKKGCGCILFSPQLKKPGGNVRIGTVVESKEYLFAIPRKSCKGAGIYQMSDKARNPVVAYISNIVPYFSK
jgi:hypothetical protein